MSECSEKFQIFMGDEVRVTQQDCLLLQEGHLGRVIKSSDAPSLYGKNFLVEFSNGTRVWISEKALERTLENKIAEMETRLNNPIQEKCVQLNTKQY